MKKAQKLFITMLFIFSLVCIPVVLPATVSADVLSDRLSDISTATNEGELISSILGFAVPLAIMSLVGLSAYAGFLMITSQGNPEKLNEAKEVLSNAAMGFGLIVLSVALLLIIQSILNLPGLNP